MMFDIGFIKAETHTQEYLMHKYWARKPHNVIRECIRNLTKPGDLVIDPFCGSGVTLRESSLLGRNSFGFDLNPVAVLISKVLINPPPLETFTSIFNDIYEETFEKYGYLYKTNEGYNIKYLSHSIIAKCDCGTIVRKKECKNDGRKLICPHCHNRIRFNLESLVDTDIIKVFIENDKNYIPNNYELLRQKELSKYSDPNIDTKPYNYEFPENKRILAFNGICTSDLFTHRNFCIISYFANKIWNISDEDVRDCALLLMTSTLAQCSRLIPIRNNLSTGGPAWSVPGFWIPMEHLEGNPFVHFSARFNKYRKALERLNSNPGDKKSFVILGNSLDLLSTGKYCDLKADLIFLDPPYGDSVPYTEFSNIWNSFLKQIPCSDDDISVSDRVQTNDSWANYEKRLNEYMKCLSKHLTSKGRLLVTFNNNDIRAWISLLSALQLNGFVCHSVFYQIPAVISSKAQMSIKSSYISDIYSVYDYQPEKKSIRDFSPVLSHLCFIANSREGMLSKSVLDREFMIAWLKNNVDYRLLKEKESLIRSLFSYNKKTGIYTLMSQFYKKTDTLRESVQSAVRDLVKNGSPSTIDSYLYASEKCKRFGTFEYLEFTQMINEFASDDKTIYGDTRMPLFENLD